ncbi:conserved hypothetical protein [Ignisphaera aggregans DSM 17230]|uniref:Uncharacterized protein n=1 Tax=Ignisphaera aggregans (strain DSM 17230 / JCM 13409 / AQ1.S1) TaxID=583356 RepID=E0SRP8_IGNAA|nr:conserved hypothetical protein [Ignisphaera aggregans DSM 17230]
MMLEEYISIQSSSEWIQKVREILDSVGIRYEAEEAIRIHIDDMVLQISETEDGGFTIVASIELSSRPSLQDIDRIVNVLGKTLRLLSITERELVYELDTSLPSYPFLYISIRYRDLDELLNDLRKIVRNI